MRLNYASADEWEGLKENDRFAARSRGYVVVCSLGFCLRELLILKTKSAALFEACRGFGCVKNLQA